MPAMSRLSCSLPLSPLSPQRPRRHTAAQAEPDVSLQQMLTEPVNVISGKRRVCPKPLGQQISDQLSLLQDRLGSAWSDAEKSNKDYWSQKSAAAASSPSAPPNVSKPAVAQLPGQSSASASEGSRSIAPDPMLKSSPAQPTPKPSAPQADATPKATVAPESSQNSQPQFPGPKAPDVPQSLPSSTPPDSAPAAGNLPPGNGPVRAPANVPNGPQGKFAGGAPGNMPPDATVPGNVPGGSMGEFPGNMSGGAPTTGSYGNLPGNLPDGPARFPGNAAPPQGNELMGGGGGGGAFGGGGGGGGGSGGGGFNGSLRFPGNNPDTGNAIPQPPPGNMPGSAAGGGGKFPGNVLGDVPAPRGGFPGNMPDGTPVPSFPDDAAARGWDWTRLAPGNVPPESVLPDLTSPPKGPQIFGRQFYPGNMPPEVPSYSPGPPLPGNMAPQSPANSIPEYMLRPGNIIPEPMQPRASFPPAGPPSGNFPAPAPGNFPGPPPGYQGPPPGNMPPPGQRFPLGSMPQPRGGPAWQNMRPPAGNLPPENTPISFTSAQGPDVISLADTTHASSSPLLHHSVLEASSSAMGHGTASIAPVTTVNGDIASGVVDASVAAGTAAGGALHQLSVHACENHAAHGATCEEIGSNVAQLAEVPMHANGAVHGMVAAVADAWHAAGHMLA